MNFRVMKFIRLSLSYSGESGLQAKGNSDHAPESSGVRAAAIGNQQNRAGCILQ